MNKVLLKSASVLTALLIAGPVIASTASAATVGGDYTSSGYVNFAANTSPTNPVDPTDPTLPVGPTNPDGSTPTPGTNGPLSIDFASSLSFGTQTISSNDATYYAHAQWISTDSTGAATDETRPDYVQVTDNRGTWTGWTLTVAEANQFQDAAGDQLTGAELGFSNGYTAGTTAATPGYVNNGSFVVGTAATKILGAGANEGMGTWVYGLGSNADYQENGGAHLDNDAVSTASPITLKVIAGTNKATAYTTTLNWSLTEAPGN